MTHRSPPTPDHARRRTERRRAHAATQLPGVLETDDRTWFSADHHFGHANVLKFDRRPFADIDEMERALVENHNRTVPERDATVIFLGDLVYLKGGRQTDWKRTVRSMHGDRKIVLLGNHDAQHTQEYGKVFDAVVPEGEALTLRWRGREVRCVHSPEPLCRAVRSDFRDRPAGYGAVLQALETGDAGMEGAWFCGHVHSVFRKLGPVVNVGVDAWDFCPVNVVDAVALLDGPGVGIAGIKGFAPDSRGYDEGSGGWFLSDQPFTCKNHDEI